MAKYFSADKAMIDFKNSPNYRLLFCLLPETSMYFRPKATKVVGLYMHTQYTNVFFVNDNEN